MRKLCLIAIAAFLSVTVKAQLKVHSNGNITLNAKKAAGMDTPTVKIDSLGMTIKGNSIVNGFGAFSGVLAAGAPSYIPNLAIGAPATSGTTQNGSFRLRVADNAVLDFGMYASGNGAWVQTTNQTDLSAVYPLLINPNGGNVGIGTSSPAALLHVRNGTTNTGTIQIGGTAYYNTVSSDAITGGLTIDGDWGGSNQIITLKQRGTAKYTLDGYGNNIWTGGGSFGGLLQTTVTSTTNPSLQLNYNGSSTYARHLMNPNGDYVISAPSANGVTSGRIIIQSSGGDALIFNTSQQATFVNSVTAPSFTQSSDIRYKNILSRSGDMITYKWKPELKRDAKTHFGYVAQEVEKTYPDQVETDEKGYKSVNYIELLVKKINDLEKLVETLNKRLEQVEKK